MYICLVCVRFICCVFFLHLKHIQGVWFICTLLQIHTNAQTLECLLQRAKTSERPRLTHLLRANARVYSRKFACSPTVFCGRFVIVFSTYTQFSLLLSYVSSYFFFGSIFFFLSILGRKLNIVEKKGRKPGNQAQLVFAENVLNLVSYAEWVRTWNVWQRAKEMPS